MSTLQIYGAAIDKDSLLFNSIPSAQPSGSLTRLEVSLTPNIKEVVGGGQIRFSLPVPTLSLSQLLAAKPFSAPEGQLIEKEVISSLCSPKGIPVSVSPDHLLKAALAQLYSQPLPQPPELPVEAALARTEQALQAAKRASQQSPTQKVIQRVERHSA